MAKRKNLPCGHLPKYAIQFGDTTYCSLCLTTANTRSKAFKAGAEAMRGAAVAACDALQLSNTDDLSDSIDIGWNNGIWACQKSIKTLPLPEPPKGEQT